ncbi:MAG: ATP-binding cassette domain-containing protein, partial [Clostridia bacterium]|nr:ATP-binding cassette domain-containing protein [Clostridia bacterium]
MRFLEAEGLSKTYIRRCKPKDGGISRLWKRDTQVINALQDASFSVDEGELVGLIGPNGAGKSTTVKLLTGILTPTGGTCRVDGRVPWLERREHVRHLGAVFGQRTQLWWDVPIHDSFLLLRDVYSLDKAAWQRRLDELVDALDLEEFLHTPLRQLSLGQRMRAELCGSLLHQPRLLFLDEPTIGLDAVSKLKLRAFLKEENRQRGTTILLTTHDMEDMLALCQRVMVLGRG